MHGHPDVKTNEEFCIPESMKAWVLVDPGQLTLTRKAVPVPGRAEVLVRIDAIAICATDLDNIYRGPPAMIEDGLPFSKNWTPGHEYMGTVVALGPGVDEYEIGQRVAVEISCRLRPLQTLPRGYVHVLPQLRPQLRQCRQRPPRHKATIALHGRGAMCPPAR
jgi:threonine dehydrogenase-like Zn-dependent dehydrogenase